MIDHKEMIHDKPFILSAACKALHAKPSSLKQDEKEDLRKNQKQLRCAHPQLSS